ncbi:MAG: hypothetical protein HQL51_04390 [Magnetococcales bacterium]|nr:hypothetical protein [Magnetococcales bacterium]
MTVMVELSEEWVEEAKRSGRAASRTLSKQIEHWMRMGKIAEENPDLPLAMIQDILQSRSEDKAGLEEYCFG